MYIWEHNICLNYTRVPISTIQRSVCFI